VPATRVSPGVWYYRLVTKDYDFPVPVFVLPEHGEDRYHAEVLTLKQQLEQQTQEKYKARRNWKLSSR
jgi:type I restriction enzyme R subunit